MHPDCSSRRAGFTLVELLVAMTVLLLLVVSVNQLVFSTAATTTASRKHMDADNQARLIFDRLANDFGKMLKRPDVDYFFYKLDGNGTAASGLNDKFFFYSEAPAYSTGSSGLPQSSVALVGYRINKTTFQLERLSQGLTWDTATSNNATATTADANSGGVVYLFCPSTLAVPAATTTLAGNWSKTIGTLANTYDDGVSPNYHPIGDQILRLELAYLLTDGTVSTQPWRSKAPATWPAAYLFYRPTNANPTLYCDGNTARIATAAFPLCTIGSRWYNTTSGRCYICTSAASDAAVWTPIGIQDISAVIVALAFVDSASRSTSAQLSTISSALLDPQPVSATSPLVTGTPPGLMASLWSGTINSAAFLTTAGISKPMAANIRIYQRYFYLTAQ